MISRDPIQSVSYRYLKKVFFSLVVGNIAVLNAACAAPQSPPTDSSTKEQSMSGSQVSWQKLNDAFGSLERQGFKGLVAVSAADGRIVVKSFSDVDEKTLFDVGSITKTVTAVSAMKLVEKGTLSLDTTIGDVYPTAPPDKALITLHQLLTHSAGFTEAIGSDFEKLERSAFLERAFSRPLISVPGEKYEYSNVGYSIIAAMIEKRSGKGFETFLIEEVLEAAGLTDIGYQRVFSDDRSARTEDGKNIAIASWGGKRPYWNLIGNGGLLMSAESAIAFRRAFLDGRIVSADSVALIQRPHIREGAGAPSYYGYGLVVQEHPTLGSFYWHNGGNNVFSANWTDYSDKGLLVFAASPNRRILADNAVMAVTGSLFGTPSNNERRDQLNRPPNAETITRVKSLTFEFVDTITSPDQSVWESFLTQRASSDFLAIAPMEKHIEIFGKIHSKLLGYERGQVSLSGPDEIEVIMTKPNTNQEKVVFLGFVDEGSGLFAGVQIDD